MVISVSKLSGAETGDIKPWAGDETSPPSGWLLCDGSAVSQSTYADLYAVIGLTYGNPGGGNFNLPDMRGKSPIGVNNSSLPNGVNGSLSVRNRAATGGEESHSLTSGENASHGHSVNETAHRHGLYYTTGGGSQVAFDTISINQAVSTIPAGDTTSPLHAQSTGLSINSSGSGTAHNTMHPFVAVNFIIKT